MQAGRVLASIYLPPMDLDEILQFLRRKCFDIYISLIGTIMVVLIILQGCVMCVHKCIMKAVTSVKSLGCW
jgi:hypothetical protein